MGQHSNQLSHTGQGLVINFLKDSVLETFIHSFIHSAFIKNLLC